MARLGDICKKDSSSVAQKDLENHNGTYPIYGASGFIKNVDFYHQENPYVAVVKDGAGVGRVMKLPAKSSVIGTMQYIIPNDGIDVSYLAYALDHMKLSKYYTGATIPHIYFKDYCNEIIPIHSESEQYLIANTLDKVSNLISLRKQQLSKLDELVKARFVEMFGDPKINSKRFKIKKGSELFKISNGKAVPNDKRFEEGVPAYGGNGISWYTDEILHEQDTIVIGRVGFQSGNVHLVKGPVWVTDNAMYISDFYDDSLSLVFLYEMMEQIDFTRLQDAGDLKKVTQKPFMEMDYILPSKQLQDEYMDFVEQTDKSKLEIQKSLEKLETLKKALMQKYFG